MSTDKLLAPFPYFGGKRLVAEQVWKALGSVGNYVEPFFGSGAVLLNRPAESWKSKDDRGIETVNDKSAFLSNFWRALQSDPEGVARECDWPVNEVDLTARHRWLISELPKLRDAQLADPCHFDVRIAGWWVWGACCWIGQGWALETGARVTSQIPHLGNGGQGINRVSLPDQASRLAYLKTVSDRFRDVRVVSGDWSRVCTDAVTWRHGVTGVFLDPPYNEGNQQYAVGGTGSNLSQDVRQWALESGKNPLMRIILAGYEGEHAMPENWRCVPWKTQGGYGGQRKGGDNINSNRERLWLSPHCLTEDSVLDLF